MTQISERLLVQAHLDAKQPVLLTAQQEAELRAEIAAELKRQNAVLVAHYYCDPVIQARIKKMQEEGGNPFFDFQVPRAILALRQGVGRLMRSSQDRGVIAIMDVRLFTKRYGKAFRQSLPPSPLCRDVDDVATFFRSQDAPAVGLCS